MDNVDIINAIKNLEKKLDGLEKKLIEKMETTIDAINNKIDVLTKELDNEKQKNYVLQEKVISIEKRLRSKNIIIHGIEEVDGENAWEKVEKIINGNLKVKFGFNDVDNIKRLGNITNKKRPILLSLHSQMLRNDIMRKKSSLRHLEEKIFLTDDLPKELAEKRKKIRSMIKEINKDEKKIIFKNGQPTINNEVITENALITIYEQLKKRDRSADEEDLTETDEEDVTETEPNREHEKKAPQPKSKRKLFDLFNRSQNI